MADGPDNKPTQQLPAVPEWAIELTKSVKAGFAKNDADMAALDSKVDTLAHGLGTVTDEVSTIKVDLAEFKGTTNEKFRSHSIPIRDGSQTDLKHSADIAQMRAEIAANTGITTEVKNLILTAAQTPTVRAWAGRVVAGAGVLALAVMGYATLAVNQRMAVLQTQADKQPSIIVVPIFDAGGSDAHP